MNKAKQHGNDRPRVEPLGDLKIAESRGKPSIAYSIQGSWSR